MNRQADVVFLLDVDNTLLDHDLVIEDYRRHLTEAFGPELARCYWDIFEEYRREVGYADYLGALQRFRIGNPREPRVIATSLFLLHYPFDRRVYPGTFDVITRLQTRGPVVVLSDGDVVFQPRKVERSGIWAAVEGEVLIYVHKEHMLDDVERRYPAKRYVMVDDKVRILAAMKETWGDRLTTVFVRQGHYATDAALVAKYPAADVSVDAFGDLLHHVENL